MLGNINKLIDYAILTIFFPGVNTAYVGFESCISETVQAMVASNIN